MISEVIFICLDHGIKGDHIRTIVKMIRRFNFNIQSDLNILGIDFRILLWMRARDGKNNRLYNRRR